MKVKHLGQICVGPSLSEKQLRQISSALKKDKDLESKFNTYRLLSGKARYKILRLIYDLKELCVCDLAEILDTTVSAVSHQLRVLRKADIVATRRKGQTIYYSLKSEEIKKLL